MLALQKLSAEAGPPSLAEVPMPVPSGGEARVAVTAAGLCGTDFHILDGDYPSRPPVTLGHEVAGIVDCVGPGVDDAWIGFEAVAIALLPPSMAATRFSNTSVVGFMRRV